MIYPVELTPALALGLTLIMTGALTRKCLLSFEIIERREIVDFFCLVVTFF